MDNKHDILTLLRSVADGATSPEEALLNLKEVPFEDLDYAKIDYHRSVRQGASEVIYGEGKTPEQIKGLSPLWRGGDAGIYLSRVSVRKRPTFCAGQFRRSIIPFRNLLLHFRKSGSIGAVLWWRPRGQVICR